MAIFTKPAAKGGRNVVGCKVTCTYNDKNIEGIVESQRKVEGKGNLLVVKVDGGFKSFYFERATNVMFYVPRETRNTDDGYDAYRDRMVNRYGVNWRRR